MFWLWIEDLWKLSEKPMAEMSLDTIMALSFSAINKVGEWFNI